MQLDVFPLLSTVVLVSTIVTMILAAFSYVAYRRREKKGASPSLADRSSRVPAAQTKYFRRYEPKR